METRRRDDDAGAKYMRQLCMRLLEQQEAERRRISRHLHDEVGQLVSYLRIELPNLVRAESGEQREIQLRECNRVLDLLSGSVQDLEADLRPPMLDSLGLVSSLRWYLHRKLDAASFDKEMSVEGQLPGLSPALETVAFRVAQEALTNTVRHARASAVSLSLKTEGHCLLLRIDDDGVGFEAAAKISDGALGLLEMRERLSAVGGTLWVESASGEGTRITARIPLSGRDSSGDSE